MNETPDIDRTGDYGGRWRGKVINVMDPKKQGRIQVRVFGLHDNETLIPDKDLPWVLPSIPINAGASYRGVSASPVGVIPGSIVDGYFADRQRTILIATGTLQSAGRTKSGETIDGSYALDPAYNDVTNSARGKDLNAALGLKNFPAISQIGAVFPNVSAGVGYHPQRTGNILSLLSSIDPKNMSGVLSGSVTNFIKAQAMTQLGSSLGSLGSITSLVQNLSSLQAGASQISSLRSQLMSSTSQVSSIPPQLQSIASLGNLSTVLSLARSIASNPSALLKNGIGGLMSQAVRLAPGIGSAAAVLNKAMGFLSIASQQREFSLQAAAPTPPPLPEVPATTSSKASTTPTTSKAGTDPYAIPETYQLPDVMINSQLIDKSIGGNEYSESVPLELTATPQPDTTAENENILKQIGSNSETQAAAAADSRAVLENRLSPKDRAAQQRAINISGGIF